MGTLLTILNVSLKVVSFIITVVTYPIKYIMVMLHLTSSKLIPKAVRIMLMVVHTILLSIWMIVVIMLLNKVDNQQIVELGGLTTVLHEEGYIDLNAGTQDTGRYPGVGNGGFNLGGSDYNIDLDNINPNVSIPSGMYQNGTAKQRAEMLLIVQEICNRPEIQITPVELLGLLYAENTGYIAPSGSLTHYTWPEKYNKYHCGGPFQHQRFQWAGDSYKNGKTFISTIEDPTLSDSQRVKTKAESAGMVTKDGKSRPSMFLFPDAAYSAALRLSLTLHDSKTASTTNWAKEATEWAQGNGMNTTQVHTIKMNSTYAYYNSYTTSQHSYIPALIGDIMKKHGAINQWSSLATKRSNLNTKLRDDLIPNTTRTLNNLKERNNLTSNLTYSQSLKNGNWESTQFSFQAFNGGQYIYNGLMALVEQVGEKVEHGNPNSIYTKIVATDWSVAHTKWPRMDEGGPTVMHLVDVATGEEFSLTRTVGTQHMDVEPTTPKDTATLKRIWGSDWDSWTMRAMLVKDGTTLHAASLVGKPHAPNLDFVDGNDFTGVLCLHFRGSKTHTDGKHKTDQRHQDQVNIAEKAVRYLKPNNNNDTGTFNPMKPTGPVQVPKPGSGGGSIMYTGIVEPTTVENGLVIVNGFARPLMGDPVVVSPYGWRKKKPLEWAGVKYDPNVTPTQVTKGIWRMHAGIDLRAQTPQNLYSTKAGKVVKTTLSGGGTSGKYITIEHSNPKMYSTYMHLSEIYVSVGQVVSRGQYIGKTGNSGGVDYHLHFQLMQDQTYKHTIDPSFMFNVDKKWSVYK